MTRRSAFMADTVTQGWSVIFGDVVEISDKIFVIAGFISFLYAKKAY